MAASMKFVLGQTASRFPFMKCAFFNVRSFSTTHFLSAKKVLITTDDNQTVIEAKPLEEEKEVPVRKIKAKTGCPLCEVQNKITYRDVLILHQFVSANGRVLPRHVTGMCEEMQGKLEGLLYQSYSAGLLPNYKPHLTIFEDPKTFEKNYKWRKLNVYYEDFTFHDPK